MTAYEYAVYVANRQIEWARLAAYHALISTAVCDTTEEKEAARKAAKAAHESADDLEAAVQHLDEFANRESEFELRRQCAGHVLMLRRIADEAQAAADKT